MSLVKIEISKLWNKPIRLLCILALVFNLVGIYYISIESNASIPTKDYIYVMKLYRDDPISIENDYMRLQNAMEQYVDIYMEALENGEEINPFAHEFEYSSNHQYFTDLDVLGTFFTMRDETQKYEDTICRYIEQAEKNKSRLTIIGDENAFSYRYQDAIIERYTSVLQKVNLDFDYIYGWNTLFSYSGDVVLVFLVAMLIAGTSVIMEKTTGVYPMLTVTRKGRGKTAIAKIVAVVLLTGVMTLLLRLESFISVGIIKGYSNMLNPVQLLQDYVLCPFTYNCIELFVYNMLFLMLSSICVSMVVITISIITKWSERIW